MDNVFINELPFPNLTNYDIECLFVTAKQRINELMKDSGILQFVKERKLTNLIDTLDTISCDYYDEDSLSSLKRNGPRFLNILTLNIVSLPKHGSELVCYLNILEMCFDVIVLTEIGLRNISTVEMLLDHYTFYYVLPNSNPRGGVGIFFRNNLTDITVRDDANIKTSCGCSRCEIESLFIDFKCQDKNCTIAGIYRHPNGNVQHYIHDLEIAMNNIDVARYFILAGDANIDIIKHDNEHVLNYLAMLMSYSLLPYITLPTRITAHTSTCIDHVFIRSPPRGLELSKISGILYCDISDHLPCFVSIQIQNVHVSKERPMTRLFGEGQCLAFAENMRAFDWDSLYIPGVDWYLVFITNVKHIFNDSFPVVKVSRKRQKDKPWVTKGIKTSIKTKHRLYRISLKSESIYCTRKYKRYRNILCKCLKDAEVAYYKELFDNTRNSAYHLWNELGKIINPGKRKKDSGISKLLYEGRCLKNNEDISNCMNKFFCSVGKKLQEKIPSNNTTSFKDYLPARTESSFYIIPVSTEEIKCEISKLNPKKANGPDGIGSKVIKICPDVFSYNLEKIFNKSILDANYPLQMKVAKVIALFKKGDRLQPNNYRPISLLACCNKLFEKLICKRLLAFLKQQNILFLFQFGFRGNYSTILALIECIDNVRRLLDEGNYVLGIYIDQTKAFDTVDHDILLEKLEHYGIRGHANDFFRSYLSNRQQFTSINGTNSDTQPVSCGVPQGSVLGPILFLIYVNDMANAVSNGNIRLFADDTGLYIAHKNIDNLTTLAKNEMSSLFKWCQINKLTVNYSKTCFLLYHTKNKPVPVNFDHIDVDGIRIERSYSVKYLGVTIDEKLLWHEHVDNLCKSLIKYFGIFNKIKYFVTQKIARQIYFAFIFSRINYAIELYGTCSGHILSKVQTIQSKLLKLLLCRPILTPTDALHKDLRVLKVSDLYKVNILVFVNKCLMGLCPDIFMEYYTHKVSAYNLRNTDLYIPRCRTKLGSLSAKVVGAKLWNDMSPTISAHFYKKNFKKHLLSNIISGYGNL